MSSLGYSDRGDRSLQNVVETAQAKSADLAETKTFRELLNQLNSNPALRLPAKAVIQKKVSRIELAFMPDRLGVAAFLHMTGIELPAAETARQSDVVSDVPSGIHL
jgi:hypothetical protein